MKKISVILSAVCMLLACSNNNGESGVQNDGISPIDSNGGLADTTYNVNNTMGTDTAAGEGRVDISTRDTFNR